MDPRPAGYMTLRTTTTDGLSDYDNPDNMKKAHGYDVPNMKNPHGYDVPKGSLAGYEKPKNTQTDRHMPGTACNDMDLINLGGMVYRISESKTNTEGCFKQCSKLNVIIIACIHVI